MLKVVRLSHAPGTWGMDKTHDWPALALYTSLSLCVFLVDVLLPLGNSAAVPYVAVVLLTIVRAGPTSHALKVATTTTALTIAGYVFSETSADAATEVYHRITAGLAIWMVAFAGTVQKRQEALSQRAKEFSDSIVDAVRRPLLVVDRDLRVRRVNQSFCASFEATPDEVVGLPFAEIQGHQWNHAGLLSMLRDSFSQSSLEIAYELDKDFPRLGERVLLINARPILEMNGDRGNSVVVSIEDITHKKQGKRALLAAERKYRDLYDNAPDMYGSVDPKTKQIVECNATLCTTLGFNRSELLGRPVSSIYHRDCHDRVHSAFETFVETGQVHNAELELRTKSGARIPVLLNLTAVRNASGEITRCHSTWRDVTDRKRAEEASRMLAAIVSSSADAICAIDLSGVIVSWNAAAETMYGYSEREILGCATEVLVPDALEKEWYGIMDRAASGERVQQFETLRLTKDGREFDVSLTVSPLRQRDGEIVGAAMLSRDISEKKEAERQLQQYNATLQEQTEQLEVANKDLESFSYSVSHDLRAPLRAIGGYSELLLNDYGSQIDDRGFKAVTVIARNAAKMEQLIESLLRFSRLGRQPISRRHVNMESLACEAFEQASSLEPGRSFEFTVDRLPPIDGDEALLGQVWANLVGNAVKYTRPRPKARIVIDGRVHNGEAVYSIRDNGVGFDDEYAERLFAVFQRLHSATEFEGTGVGLALTERIIGRHGGRIWAEATQGKGARFYFALPRAVPPADTEKVAR